jgi:hypothetical protein
MRTTIRKYAIGAALSGILALRAASGFGHIHARVDVPNHVTQFCIPAHGDDVDAHRFYCVKGDESGWIGATVTAFM